MDKSKKETIISAFEIGEHLSFMYKGKRYDFEPTVEGDCLFDSPNATEPIAKCEAGKAVTDLYFDGKLLLDVIMESEFI